MALGFSPNKLLVFNLKLLGLIFSTDHSYFYFSLPDSFYKMTLVMALFPMRQEFDKILGDSRQKHAGKTTLLNII